MMTDKDVRAQVIASLDGRELDYDVDKIVDGFVARWGVVSIDDESVDPTEYWTGLVVGAARETGH